MDWLGIISDWILNAIDVLWSWIMWVWENLYAFIQWSVNILAALWNGIVWVARKLYDGVKALRHLNFRHIWEKIKKGYQRYKDALDWWKRNVQEPLDRMRRQVWQVYRIIFRPILDVLDTFRSMIRPLAIFNRRLAARLDHYLMELEGKLLLPITATLHRINEISSYITALITTAGRLARPLLLESMRRDALLVWEVLTNPRAVLYSPPEPVLRPTIEAAGRDFREYLEHGTGTLTLTEAEDHAAFLQGYEEAG